MGVKSGKEIAIRCSFMRNDCLGLNLLLPFSFDIIDNSLWKQQRGLTLREFGFLLAQRYRLQYAINLDGGGSSTILYHYQLLNRPKCLDTAFPVCQRPVATVLCIRGDQRKVRVVTIP